MANGKIDLKNCSKQEIIDVIKAAKLRKQAWEERVQAEMRERQALRQKAQESHYYDIALNKRDAIIEYRHNQNPDILLYLCSTDRGQQAQRSRLFLRWFNGYEQQKKYMIKSAEVKGDGVSEYISLIAMNCHPKIAEISEAFDHIIQMFNNNK